MPARAKIVVNPTMLLDYATGVPVDADTPLPVNVANVTTPVQLTGDVVVDTLGALDNARETNPDAASATIPALLRGLLAAAASAYETVAASQTAQVLGGSGAAGDFIKGLLVIPATTSPGNVLLLDNATSITVFPGGASSVADLKPFFIPLGLRSASGAWKVTTGANVSVIGIGKFT
jgi:hypothetical protein